MERNRHGQGWMSLRPSGRRNWSSSASTLEPALALGLRAAWSTTSGSSGNCGAARTNVRFGVRRPGPGEDRSLDAALRRRRRDVRPLKDPSSSGDTSGMLVSERTPEEGCQRRPKSGGAEADGASALPPAHPAWASPSRYIGHAGRRQVPPWWAASTGIVAPCQTHRLGAAAPGPPCTWERWWLANQPRHKGLLRRLGRR